MTKDQAHIVMRFGESMKLRRRRPTVTAAKVGEFMNSHFRPIVFSAQRQAGEMRKIVDFALLPYRHLLVDKAAHLGRIFVKL